MFFFVLTPQTRFVCFQLYVKGFDEYTAKHYTCPLCKKSLTDMKDFFGTIDKLLEAEFKGGLPPELANRRSAILCQDCGERSVTQFHLTYHKCQASDGGVPCGSYNTVVERSGDNVSLE